MESGPPLTEASSRRKRPDVTDRLLRRRGEREAVVKASLLRHLLGAKALLRAAIQARVDAYSKRMHLASTALSGLLKGCFDGVLDVADAVLPDFGSQTFFRQLLLGVEDASSKDAFVQAYYDAHFHLYAKLRQQPRHLGDRNVYSAGAKLYQTNFRNSFVTNFRGRLNRWLRAFQTLHGLSDEQRVWMLYAVHGWSTHGRPPVTRTQSMADAVAEQRRALGLVGAEEVTPRWLDMPANLHRLVRQAVLVCRWMEEAGQPAFDLVPIARRGAHFVTIDTSVLHGLMKDIGLVECNLDTFSSLRNEQWCSVLKINQLLGGSSSDNRRQFTGTIQTDGVSLCVHYRLPKTPTAEAPVVRASVTAKGPLADRGAELTVLGMDPGRSNIYCFALQREDGTARTWKFRRGQYYNASGILRAKKQAETWQRGVREVLMSLSDVSTKGTSVAEHERFLATNLAAFDPLWHEYMKPRWARQRLRLYGGKHRAFAAFLNRVEEEARIEGGGKPVAVAYGAAKFAPSARGEVAVPTTRAFRECAARFETVVLVDEFRTTKVCATDGSVLKAVRSRATGAAVRGLLWYDSTISNKFVDRDLNAALNIRRCAVLPRRPRELCRVEGQAPLGCLQFGKTIRK